MRPVNPIVSPEHALLVFADPLITSSTIYIPHASKSTECVAHEALYTISATDKARLIIVRRGSATVAEIHYPSEFRRRKSSYVVLSGKKTLFDEWLPGAGKAKLHHELMIGGEEYSWTESARDGIDTYPLLKGGEVFGTFIPAVSNLSSGERICTRAHIEFAAPTLPEESILDEIIASLVVIQHTNNLRQNGTDGSLPWIITVAMFCTVM